MWVSFLGWVESIHLKIERKVTTVKKWGCHGSIRQKSFKNFFQLFFELLEAQQQQFEKLCFSHSASCIINLSNNHKLHF
ncbi:CLUMA_CG012417, isoform A [Clunio marinus]|uniref:CLUMA_CG012417, isoform A n=1 Tax=Clunio marinus TaxID=568069 RepID=A0A1J1IEP2_9DIPT|nr:CLUMA_CG012417, isoform A [Clunio marinus]